MSAIKELLRADGSIIINKKLSHNIGLHETIMYSELLSKEAYFEGRNELKDGWFFNTIENMQKDTTLSEHQQRKAVKKLKTLGLIESKSKGMPAKRYFRIIENEELVKTLITQEARPKCNISSLKIKDHVPNTYSAPSDTEKIKHCSLKSAEHSSVIIQEHDPEKVRRNNTNLNNTKNNTKINNVTNPDSLTDPDNFQVSYEDAKTGKFIVNDFTDGDFDNTSMGYVPKPEEKKYIITYKDPVSGLPKTEAVLPSELKISVGTIIEGNINKEKNTYTVLLPCHETGKLIPLEIPLSNVALCTPKKEKKSQDSLPDSDIYFKSGPVNDPWEEEVKVESRKNAVEKLNDCPDIEQLPDDCNNSDKSQGEKVEVKQELTQEGDEWYDFMGYGPRDAPKEPDDRQEETIFRHVREDGTTLEYPAGKAFKMKLIGHAPKPKKKPDDCNEKKLYYDRIDKNKSPVEQQREINELFFNDANALIEKTKKEVGSIERKASPKKKPDEITPYNDLKDCLYKFLLKHYQKDKVDDYIFKTPKELNQMSKLLKKFTSKPISVFEKFLDDAENNKFLKTAGFLPSMLNSKCEAIILQASQTQALHHKGTMMEGMSQEEADEYLRIAGL